MLPRVHGPREVHLQSPSVDPTFVSCLDNGRGLACNGEQINPIRGAVGKCCFVQHIKICQASSFLLSSLSTLPTTQIIHHTRLATLPNTHRIPTDRRLVFDGSIKSTLIFFFSFVLLP